LPAFVSQAGTSAGTRRLWPRGFAGGWRQMGCGGGSGLAGALRERVAMEKSHFSQDYPGFNAPL
jgi:hypothetical protein